MAEAEEDRETRAYAGKLAAEYGLGLARGIARKMLENPRLSPFWRSHWGKVQAELDRMAGEETVT